MDIIVNAGETVKSKVCEKLEKCVKIARKKWKKNIMYVKVTVVPTVISTPETVVKNLTKLMEELETSGKVESLVEFKFSNWFVYHNLFLSLKMGSLFCIKFHLRYKTRRNINLAFGERLA